MRNAPRRVHYSYTDYLALEEASPTRHEFLDGEIYGMAGGTPDHAALAARILFLIVAQLPPACRAFNSDLRVRIAATGLSTYPDAAVVCGGTERAGDDRLAVTNPNLLVEVTSNSTEEYDRGEKLRHYQTIPSLREVLIVSHRSARITMYRRDDRGAWVESEASSGESLELGSIGGSVRVDQVYLDALEDTQ